jgi:hypothetical protein
LSVGSRVRMAQLSKIVQERLRVKESAMAAHPDADLLAGFAERSLSEQERAGVMEHLSKCGDCREIVALALPAEVEAPAVSRSGVRSNWFRLPALRWAAVAAGIAVVISVGTLEYRNQSMKMARFGANVASKQEAVIAKLTQPPASNAQMEATAPASALRKELPAKKLGSEKSGGASASAEPRMRMTPHAFTSGFSADAATRGGSAAGAGKGSAATAPALDLALANAATASAAPAVSTASPAPLQPKIPAASEAVEVSSAATQVETAQAELGNDKETFSRAKPPVNQQIVSGEAMLPVEGRNVTNLQALSVAKGVPRWTITANGVLQRSYDGGATWQDVNVTGDESMSANLLLKEKVAEAKAQGKKTLEEQYARAMPVFRAVAASGMEVWAGGTGGILYHTVDAGNSWSRVVPSYEGVALGGNIVSIQFPDPQHGQISTSTGEIWTTSDRGESWQKVK